MKVFPDGSEYVGEFVNGQFSGYGTFKWSDGTVYEGHWQNNKISGEGTRTLQDGTTISGFFIGKKKLSGKGQKIWTKDGKRYVYKGDITDSAIADRGEFIFPDGRVYVGECADGVMQGNGKYVWPDSGGNAVYNGDFANNQFQVRCTNYFVGSWRHRVGDGRQIHRGLPERSV